MLTAVKTDVSLEEYCLLERDSRVRHQYINGQIEPMPYTSGSHGLIVSNLHGFLFMCLKNREDCRLYIADRMLYVAKDTENGNVYYPDLMIVEGGPVPKGISTNMEATLNPSVLIEILSGSNSDNDRTMI